HEFVPSASLSLAEQVYPRKFQEGNEQQYLTGYRPYGSSFLITPTYTNDPTGTSSVSATVVVNTTFNTDDDTGYSRSTMALTRCHLYYPPVWNTNTYGSQEIVFDKSRIV